MKSLGCFCLIILSLSTVSSLFVVVYEDKHYSCCSSGEGCGRCTEVDFKSDTCFTLSIYNDKISSIDVYGNCIRIWEHAECNGFSMQVDSSTLSLDDLSKIPLKHNQTWDDQIGSISGCDYVPLSTTSWPFQNFGNSIDDQSISGNNCFEYEFECFRSSGSERRCIPLLYKCDGEIDCPSAEDEVNCPWSQSPPAVISPLNNETDVTDKVTIFHLISTTHAPFKQRIEFPPSTTSATITTTSRYEDIIASRYAERNSPQHNEYFSTGNKAENTRTTEKPFFPPTSVPYYKTTTTHLSTNVYGTEETKYLETNPTETGFPASIYQFTRSRFSKPKRNKLPEESTKSFASTPNYEILRSTEQPHQSKPFDFSNSLGVRKNANDLTYSLGVLNQCFDPPLIKNQEESKMKSCKGKAVNEKCKIYCRPGYASTQFFVNCTSSKSGRGIWNIRGVSCYRIAEVPCTNRTN